MAAVGLVFAPLAPLVVLAATIVFWMSSWVYKYQLMFVFVSKVESGGVSFFTSEYAKCNLTELLPASLECRCEPSVVLCAPDASIDDSQ